MLHEKKKQSLLSWVQSAGGHDVTSFSQLYDGKLLNELVVTLSDKDCYLSSKAEIEAEETDSIKPSEASVAEKEQNELTKETIDSLIEKIESNGQEQEAINGYHDSTTNELNPSGVFTHADVKTEDGDISENGVITESSDSVLLNELTVNMNSQEAEDKANTDVDNNYEANTDVDSNYKANTDVDKNCISVDSSDVSVNGSIKMDCSVSNEHSNSVKNIDTDFNIPIDSPASEIEGRYVVVQKFIESMLELKCVSLVNFLQCFEGHELELAKLTVLLLSAMVQYSLSTKKDHIMASCYSLSPDAQEEIMDCLELFLKERQSPIERKEFHSRLSRRAKLRISPRKHSNTLSTPQLHKPAKRGRKRKACNNVEEFLDKGFESPIQNLIQSPGIRHITPNSEARLLDAVRCKDKTIALLTYDLDVEKYTVDDLKKQNEDLSSQLSKLRKENKKLKEELDEVQANLENNELSFEKAQQLWKSEVKSYQSQIKDLKDAEKFWKESYKVEDNPATEKLRCTCSEEIGSLKCAMQAKDDKLKECQKEIEILTVQLEMLKQEREDLISKVEENPNFDNQSSCGRSSTQEKCLNITDLHQRNELKSKCKELQNNLNRTEIEYSVKIQKLEELLFQKDKVEKEFKARLRKTDKEREDAINNQKKLEIENSNLKGQIEAFKNVLPVSSPLLPKALASSTPANRRSLRSRNVGDSEKVGQLWHTYEDETDVSVAKTGPEPDRVCSESSIQSENKSLNSKAVEKSQNKLWRSQSVSSITSSKESCKRCSQNDFYEVSPLIQNICKIVREDNILDTDILLELHRYEKDFDMNDLVKVLTLLTKILLEGTSHRNRSKHVRDLSSLDLNSDINIEQVKMSAANEPEQPRRKSITVNTVPGGSNQRPRLDNVSCTSRDSNSIKIYRQLLKEEKKKVACLQSKLKNLKNSQSLDKEKLQQLQTELAKKKILCDTNVERVRTVSNENELIRKEIHELREEMERGRPAPIIQRVVETTPPPPCENCPKLNEEILSYRIRHRDLESSKETLKSDVEIFKFRIKELKQELCKLSKKNDELEEKLSDPRIVGLGVYSPKLKTLRDTFRESLYKDVESADAVQQKQCINDSAATNYSFTAPSVSGFGNNNRNQTQLRAFCKVEDEADMLSQSSIFEMQSDTPNKRLNEINRRNTLCLPHLKSQYPLELNTTPSQHKYFQPPATPSCSRDMTTSDKESVHLAKKRKISKPSSVRASFASLVSSTSGYGIQCSSTPKNFTDVMHKTNTSAARLHFRKFKDSMGK